MIKSEESKEEDQTGEKQNALEMHNMMITNDFQHFLFA